MIDVRAIDLREHLPGSGDATGPGHTPPKAIHWVCQPCRWGDHDDCQYPLKICYCVECYGDEQQDE